MQSEDGVTLEGETLASLAVSGGSMFIRTDSALYRIGAPPIHQVSAALR